MKRKIYLPSLALFVAFIVSNCSPLAPSLDKSLFSETPSSDEELGIEVIEPSIFEYRTEVLEEEKTSTQSESSAVSIETTVSGVLLHVANGDEVFETFKTEGSVEFYVDPEILPAEGTEIVGRFQIVLSSDQTDLSEVNEQFHTKLEILDESSGRFSLSVDYEATPHEISIAVLTTLVSISIVVENEEIDAEIETAAENNKENEPSTDEVQEEEIDSESLENTTSDDQDRSENNVNQEASDHSSEIDQEAATTPQITSPNNTTLTPQTPDSSSDSSQNEIGTISIQ